VTNFA
jgi:hypothetical protein